ncbi:hypothetical protein DID88_000972 [Monilinia fructigena]|uniref:Uncharacterized protein n=1 Tax=Monilinia fructigena TaxID=38457 RepID=A0A395IZY0_9HELO|nr:hypothetical protein DID88_000972 [Monilinia fructigena]
MTDWGNFEDVGIVLAIMVAVLFAMALLFESFRTTTWWVLGRVATPVIWIWGCLVGLGGILFGRGVVRIGGDRRREFEEGGNGNGNRIELEDLERGAVGVGVAVVDTEFIAEAESAYTGDGGDVGNGDGITVSQEVHVETFVGFVNTA